MDQIHGLSKMVSLFVCFCFAMLSLPSASCATNDYFERITVFSRGRIAHFSDMPIRVYVSPMLETEAYLDAIRHAMIQWESASGGIVEFKETTVSGEADIRVSWGTAGLWPIAEMTGAKTELTRLDATRSKVEMILVPPESELVRTAFPSRLRAICLHEFGHAIGLWGHSPMACDVGFHASSAQRPTRRDINTLLRVYATPLNTPQHERAIKSVQEDLDATPEDARRYYLLGTITADKGDIDGAITHLKTALTLDSNLEFAREKLLQVCQDFGRYEQAIQLLNDALTETPSHEAYNTLGVMYYRDGKIEESITAFQHSLRLNSHDPAARHNLHQIFREKGLAALNAADYSQVSAYFEQALRFSSRDSGTIHRLIADSYTKRGDFPSAIAQYQKALEINPSDREVRGELAGCYNNYGVQLRSAHLWEDAIHAYSRALEVMPTFVIARSNLIDVFWQIANSHRRTGNLKEAIAAYRQIVSIDMRDSGVHSMLGELYLKRKAYPSAIESFKEALKHTSKVVQARHNLIAAYTTYAQDLDSHAQYDAAIKQLRLALSIAPAQENLRLSLGRVYQNAGKFNLAQAQFAQVLRDQPESEAAKRESVYLRTVYGERLMNEGKYGLALAEFEAIPECERSLDIYNTIAYLYLIRRNLSGALAALESVCAISPTDETAFQNLLAIESQLIRKPPYRMNRGVVNNLLVRVRNQLTVYYMNRGAYREALTNYRAATDLVH